MMFKDSDEAQYGQPRDSLMDLIDHAKTCDCDQCQQVDKAAPHVAAIRVLRNHLCGELDLSISPNEQRGVLEAGMSFINALFLEAASMIDTLTQISEEGGIGESRPQLISEMVSSAKLNLFAMADPKLRERIEQDGAEADDPVDLTEDQYVSPIKRKPKRLDGFDKFYERGSN